MVISLFLLVGCERPDPEDSVAETTVEPTATPTVPSTPMATPTPLPTLLPMQFFVVVVQPTPVPASKEQGDVSPTPVSDSENEEVAGEPTPVGPTPIPNDYYMGWAWTRGLVMDEGRVEVDPIGLTLRDQPSSDGRDIGLVVGLGEAVIIGREQCGYTPVIVHVNDMLQRITPRPEVQEPEPLGETVSTLLPSTITPPDTVAGFAYTEEMTVLGDTAITGEFGVNLRLEPCPFGENLGLIPGGANVIVTGPPVGEYTPVLVDDDVLQSPFDTTVFEFGRFFATPPSQNVPVAP